MDDIDERMKELQAFDDTKLGVKGLVDSGIVKIPKMFIRKQCEEESDQRNPCSGIPTIDFDGLRNSDCRRIVIDEVRIACENFGIFQVVNHGVPICVLDEMFRGIRKFNECDVETKKKFYRRDQTKTVNFNSNYDLFQSETVGWRDSLIVSMLTSDAIDPEELPLACRDSTIAYINHIKEFGNKVFDLLSEALGLEPEYLRSIKCNEGKILASHYYPECSEPDLAIGLSKHSDHSFITILAQDQIGGLQVLQQNQFWVDVDPIYGALIVNIGDFIQLVSNDKFKSCVHRVVPKRESRVSAAIFFTGCVALLESFYGPIKQLTSHDNPPKYRQVLLRDFVAKFFTKGLHEKPSLDELRI